MSRWFRHYAGMMRDEKLVRAAVRSKQPVERVIWIWGAILESAAEINDGGRYDFDCGEAAYFLRCEDEELRAAVAALEEMGRIAGGVVCKWTDRQYDSDSSRERQKRYRDRHKPSRGDDSDVTPPSRDAEVTVQDTDTDTDTDTEKKENARPSTRIEFETILSKILDPERVEALVGVRRKKGAVLTAHAANLLVKALSACPDISAAADEMVLRNWTSVKPDWMASRQHGPPNGKRTFVDVAMDRLNGKPNGSENIFSIDGDAQRISPDDREHGPDDGDIRSGIARRFIASGH